MPRREGKNPHPRVNDISLVKHRVMGLLLGIDVDLQLAVEQTQSGDSEGLNQTLARICGRKRNEAQGPYLGLLSLLCESVGEPTASHKGERPLTLTDAIGGRLLEEDDRLRDTLRDIQSLIGMSSGSYRELGDWMKSLFRSLDQITLCSSVERCPTWECVYRDLNPQRFYSEWLRTLDALLETARGRVQELGERSHAAKG